jgi:aspartate carbamoyltransferase catalytic subunit
MAAFNRKHLLGMEGMTPQEIETILDAAVAFKEISTRPIKKVPTLRGKTVVHFFYEPSTRTRISFEIASKRLSADTVSISAATSSIVKGETLIDTARTLEAMNPDILVIRHSSSGAPHLLARYIKTSVINAGDGTHEHPTQALLDLFTVREKKGKLAGLKLSIVGDIAHSRVARSNILGFTVMGAQVTVCGPPTMIPPDMATYPVRVVYNLPEALKGSDVVMMLRIQLERQKEALFPTLREYSLEYGLNKEKARHLKEDALIMHPGPINRGMEIDPELADGERSLILDQVTNGVAVRMALLYLMSGGESSDSMDH